MAFLIQMKILTVVARLLLETLLALIDLLLLMDLVWLWRELHMRRIMLLGPVLRCRPQFKWLARNILNQLTLFCQAWLPITTTLQFRLQGYTVRLVLAPIVLTLVKLTAP